MATIEIVMPSMGESVAEATIIKWLKNEGDKVSLDESLVEIATDKVDSDIPSETEGILVKQLFQEGEIIQVGKPFAIIKTEGTNEATSIDDSSAIVTPPTPAPIKKEAETKKKVQETITSNTDQFFSPLVKNIAKEENISQDELVCIKGTGVNNRITKTDILDYLKNRKSNPSNNTITSRTSTPIIHSEAPSISLQAGDEIIEMDRMRTLISDHMTMSKNVSAHVTSFVEADVTNIVKWRDRIKDQFETNEGEKLTFMPIFIKVISQVLREFPMVNASIDGTKIIKRKNINIGMATKLSNGNLIVPVIKNCDSLSLVGLAKKVNALASRGREGKLTPDEVQDGTYTITNIGSFGNLMGTPIINQPQVGILAVGAIKKKPAVIETPEGDTIGIRHFMYLSHSFDHRTIDGALGGQFVSRVAELLEGWDQNQSV